MVRVIVAVVLGVGAFGWGAADRAVAQDGAALEKALKETKLDYKKVKDGVFKVIIDEKPGLAVVYLEEKVLGKDRKGKDILFIYLYTEVLNTPTDFKPPVAMLSKLNDWNDKIVFGTISLAKNKDGSSVLLRNGTILLKNLDSEQLVDMISLAYFDKFRFQKEFRGFLDAP